MNKANLIFFVSLLIIFSCKEEIKANSEIFDSNNRPNQPCDTVDYLRLIPVTQYSESNKRQEGTFTQQLSRYLEFLDISNGFNGEYIRIWLPNEKSQYVVNIINDGLTQKCHVVKWCGKKSNSKEYLAVLNEVDAVPISGWRNFFDALNNYQLNTTVGSKSIKELPDFATHMYTVIFEISTIHNYKIIEFIEPSYYRYVDKKSEEIYNFLKYLNKEMAIEIYLPPKRFVPKM